MGDGGYEGTRIQELSIQEKEYRSQNVSDSTTEGDSALRPGQKTFSEDLRSWNKCSEAHKENRGVAKERRTAAQWRAAVDRLATKIRNHVSLIADHKDRMNRHRSFPPCTDTPQACSTAPSSRILVFPIALGYRAGPY